MFQPIVIAQWAWAYACKAFASVWYFFQRMLAASGMTPIYLAVTLIAIAFRLLAAPLVGVGLSVGSDLYRAGTFRAKSYSKHGGLAVNSNYGSNAHSTGMRRY